ncbi:hypothetical protein EVG20_g8891 [Dentipellis fragilis]|uniref:Uncharacterized protein n=1 Tax=Dentipellis fragilis TaxID=205917 RepID=A0A4Y9Y377_9AGAM|nr:hypothetical protein EVG20_g8891 [Dentipellis fragilis]
MRYPYLPLAAFIAATLVIIPLPWHWRARNIPTLSIMGWLFVINVIYGVNTIVWAGNVNNPSPVWCDITTKLVIGAQHALPAATFCICRSLEFIASNRVVALDRASKRRWMIFDCCICFGVPAILMALHYVVQGHRFDIVEDFGCEPATYFSVPGIMIVFFPPLFFLFFDADLCRYVCHLCILSRCSYLSGAAFYHFMKRRIAFTTHLANSNSALTTNRYLRLMGMSVVMMAWDSALTSYDLAVNTAPGLRPWISWANVHSNFSRVDLYATLILPPGYIKQVMAFWWAIPVSAYIVFFFFGLGEEAKKEYRKVWNLFRTKVLRKPAQQDFTSSLPSYNSARSQFPSKTFSSLDTFTSQEPKAYPLPLFVARPSNEKDSLSPYQPTSPSSTASLPPTPSKPLPATPVPSTPSDRLSYASIAETRLATPPHTTLSQRPFSYPTVLLTPPPPGRHRSRSSSVRLTVYSSSQVEMGEAV